MQKHYTNGEITVNWKPDLCIHSAICIKGLPQVFNLNKSPWVNMSAADTNTIMEQVNKCPSGALSYFKNEEEKQTVAEQEVIIETVTDGPVLVYGNITMKDAAGNVEKKNKVTALCRCGASSNKPFCDGSHKKIDFKAP